MDKGPVAGVSPDTFAPVAFSPGNHPKEPFPAAGLMAVTFAAELVRARLYPRRKELRTLGLNVWLSSRAIICRLATACCSTFPTAPGGVTANCRNYTFQRGCLFPKSSGQFGW